MEREGLGAQNIQLGELEDRVVRDGCSRPGLSSSPGLQGGGFQLFSLPAISFLDVVFGLCFFPYF